MNLISQIGEQIKQLFASMTPSARIMAGLMLGTIVVSLGWIFASPGGSSTENLLGGSFTNDQLDRMEAAFGEAQLRGYSREGRQIKIPTGEKDQYLRALQASNAMPKTWGSEMDEALAGGNIFESSEKLSMRHRTAREREMAAIIERIPGIEFAAVSFDEKRTGFLRETDRVCSIYVQGPFNQEIGSSLLKKISKLASSTFAGLPEDRIGVFDLGSTNFYQASSDPNAAGENPYLTNQMQWEEYFTEKASAVLQDYGAVQLSVFVELDPTLEEESERLQYDPTAIALEVSASRTDSENQRAAAGGRPGANPNAVATNEPATLSAAGIDQSSKVKKSEENQRSVAGHEAIRTRVAGLVPKKVNVSVGIPESYYQRVWAFRNPSAEGEDPVPLLDADLAKLKIEVEESVRKAVEGMPVGVRPGETADPDIAVYSYPDLPLTPIAGPTMTENALGWLSTSWSTVALLGVLLVSLGMMFSWIKSQGTAETDKKFAEGFGLEVPEYMGDELELSDLDSDGLAADGSGRAKPEFEVTGAEMKDDLSTLIKDNPDAAVNLLKTWIGEAA